VARLADVAPILRPLVADLPIDLRGHLADRLVAALDQEGKIARALDALGPIAGRDVLVVDAGAGVRSAELVDLGGRVVAPTADEARDLPDASVDAVVALWSAFRPPSPVAVAEADRVLRPEGRLLVVHDYGRDDVSRLRPEAAEFGAWSRRDGWFLRSGFRIRVIHCFWTFDSVEAAHSFLADAFGDPGAELGDSLKRPRLSYNVAVYHRSRGDVGVADPTDGAVRSGAGRR
jgi:SAM-dependent methyltransferase